MYNGNAYFLILFQEIISFYERKVKHKNHYQNNKFVDKLIPDMVMNLSSD